MRDPETGRLGKVIELVEEKKRAREPTVRGIGEESMMVQKMIYDVFTHLQTLGLMPIGRESIKPKMTLFLTEEEYELLGVKLEVNEVYELEFKDGSIKFKKAYE